MFYVWHITISKNTTEDNALEQTLKVTKGVLTRTEIFFPAGCMGFARCQIYYMGSQLYPTTRGEYIDGDNETIPIEDFFEIQDTPDVFKIKAWNLDPYYDHTITLRMTILPKEIAYAVIGMYKFAEALARAFGVATEGE